MDLFSTSVKAFFSYEFRVWELELCLKDNKNKFDQLCKSIGNIATNQRDIEEKLHSFLSQKYDIVDIDNSKYLLFLLDYSEKLCSNMTNCDFCRGFFLLLESLLENQFEGRGCLGHEGIKNLCIDFFENLKELPSLREDERFNFFFNSDKRFYFFFDLKDFNENQPFICLLKLINTFLVPVGKNLLDLSSVDKEDELFLQFIRFLKKFIYTPAINKNVYTTSKVINKNVNNKAERFLGGNKKYVKSTFGVFCFLIILLFIYKFRK